MSSGIVVINLPKVISYTYRYHTYVYNYISLSLYVDVDAWKENIVYTLHTNIIYTYYTHIYIYIYWYISISISIFTYIYIYKYISIHHSLYMLHPSAQPLMHWRHGAAPPRGRRSPGAHRLPLGGGVATSEPRRRGELCAMPWVETKERWGWKWPKCLENIAFIVGLVGFHGI